MISISEDELNDFLSQSITKTFKRNEMVSRPNTVPNEIFFINKGLIRVMIADNEGTEHTVHFALENQFISDYSNFMQKQPSFYTLQALEETQVVILPRSAIEWGYKNLQEGEKWVDLLRNIILSIKTIVLKTPFRERQNNATTVLQTYFRTSIIEFLNI